MQIPAVPNFNLVAVFSANATTPQPHATNKQRNEQQESETGAREIIARPQDNINTTRIRPINQSRPLFEQQLPLRGQQAVNIYQNVEISGDPELLHRVDELV